MASIVARKNKAGEITSWQVKWREGGDWQTERFDDESSAELFRQAVEDNGNRWPLGWVKGQGYIDPAAGTEQYRFRDFALEVIKTRTGSEERYRRDCLRDLETYIFPTFQNCDVRSTEHFNSRTVGPGSTRWPRPRSGAAPSTSP
ncbi:hypothetical protein [Streptomyces sp. 8K308]|uniref:hypothetical protein n=1 Tax=Streptomyces sp. 8K308 TaxID=2530388 RepID=UPI001FB72EF8|nr:hypothetical protein [Streptomyces sp. 8K308]